MRGEGWSSPYSDPPSAAGGYARYRRSREVIWRAFLPKTACARKLSRWTAAQPRCSEPRTGGACLERKMGATLLHFMFRTRSWPNCWTTTKCGVSDEPAPGGRKRRTTSMARRPQRYAHFDRPPRGVRDHIYEQRGITRWHDPLHKMECPIHSRFLVIILHTPFDEEWRHQVMGGCWRDGARPPVRSFGQ